MVYKTCSTQKVIAQFYRDFKPSNSGWVEDAIEWIGEAIEIMGCHQGYSEMFKELHVLDYRVKLPCEAESLIGISYKGGRLARTGGIRHKNPNANCELNKLTLSLDTYSLNPNYIHTSFQTGCITVYFEGLELDCDGYPFVIDDAMYRKALEWYILMQMLGRGFKHQVFNYKDAMSQWEATYPKAQNKCKMPDIDGMEQFKKTWTGTCRSVNRTNQFFELTGENITDSAFPPGNLLQSFQILGPNQNNP